MHARLMGGQGVDGFESFAEVVGVQNRHAGSVCEPISTHRQNVGVGPHQDAKIAVERAYPSNRFGRSVTPGIGVVLVDNPRDGQVGR